MHEHALPRGSRLVGCVALLMLGITCALGCQPTARANSSGGSACRYGGWSEPQLLERPTSLLAATRFPSALAFRPGQASGKRESVQRREGFAVGVAGFLAVEFAGVASPSQWPPQLRALRFDGRSFGSPVGSFWYAYPRSAIDHAGVVHVVWAEPGAALPSDPSTLGGKVPVLQSLWHTTFQAGAWSPAHLIYRAERIQWDEVRTSRLLVDSNDGLHIAFVADDATGPGVIYLKSEDASWRRWRSARLVSPGPIYIDLAVEGGRRVAIAFVQAVASPRPRPNVLFLLQSLDAGKNWSRPIEISTPGEDPAIEPHVFVDGHSSLQLEWVQQSAGSFTGGNVWHTVLTTTGRRSTSSLPLPTNVLTSHSQAIIDPCGTVHVMTQAYPHGASELWYARVTLQGWSTWSRPFKGRGAQASLAADGAMVHVVWNVSSRSPIDSTPRSALVHATLSIHVPAFPGSTH